MEQDTELPTSRPRRRWTPDEDKLLLTALDEFPDGNYSWTNIAAKVPGRTTKDCRKRWVSGLNSNLRKGSWSCQEDEQLRKSIDKFGTDWAKVSTELAGARSGDQCAKRWKEVLDPSIKREAWTDDEDQGLLDLYYELGTSWIRIAEHLYGRTALSCRNRACKLLVSQNKPKPGTKEAEDARKAILRERNAGFRCCDHSHNYFDTARQQQNIPASASASAAAAGHGHGHDDNKCDIDGGGDLGRYAYSHLQRGSSSITTTSGDLQISTEDQEYPGSSPTSSSLSAMPSHYSNTQSVSMTSATNVLESFGHDALLLTERSNNSLFSSSHNISSDNTLTYDSNPPPAQNLRLNTQLGTPHSHASSATPLDDALFDQYQAISLQSPYALFSPNAIDTDMEGSTPLDCRNWSQLLPPFHAQHNSFVLEQPQSQQMDYSSSSSRLTSACSDYQMHRSHPPRSNPHPIESFSESKSYNVQSWMYPAGDAFDHYLERRASS